MCPEDLLLLITSIAIAIAREVSDELLEVYANAFLMLGDALLTFEAQSNLLESSCKKQENNESVC